MNPEPQDEMGAERKDVEAIGMELTQCMKAVRSSWERIQGIPVFKGQEEGTETETAKTD